MKKLTLFLCIVLFIASCKKDDRVERELIISAEGILYGGSHEYLDQSDGIFDGYSVYLHKGKIEIPDEILNDPVTNSYKRSSGIFFNVVDAGEYTVIVDAHYAHDGAFGTSYYSGIAYTTIKYPDPDLGKKIIFDWSRDVSNYEDEGVTYTNLRPPYPVD